MTSLHRRRNPQQINDRPMALNHYPQAAEPPDPATFARNRSNRSATSRTGDWDGQIRASAVAIYFELTGNEPVRFDRIANLRVHLFVGGSLGHCLFVNVAAAESRGDDRHRKATNI